MALPFIIAGAAIAAGAFGVKKGVDAKNDLDDAERYQLGLRKKLKRLMIS